MINTKKIMICFVVVFLSIPAFAAERLSAEDEAALKDLEALVAEEDALASAEDIFVEIEGKEKELLDAARTNNLKEVEKLLKGVSDVASISKPGTWIPAIKACLAGKSVQTGKESDCININAGDAQNGYTALHYAAQNRNLAMFKLLVSKGADESVVDHDGKTPLMLYLQGSLDAAVPGL